MGCIDGKAEVRVEIDAKLPEGIIDVLQGLPPEVLEIPHHQYIDLLFKAIPGLAFYAAIPAGYARGSPQG